MNEQNRLAYSFVFVFVLLIMIIDFTIHNTHTHTHTHHTHSTIDRSIDSTGTTYPTMSQLVGWSAMMDDGSLSRRRGAQLAD
jgi:hypothetical protein